VTPEEGADLSNEILMLLYSKAKPNETIAVLAPVCAAAIIAGVRNDEHRDVRKARVFFRLQQAVLEELYNEDNYTRPQ
jgi:hypothetical protein